METQFKKDSRFVFNNTEKVRIAEVRGHVIKKRCRKEQFELIDGVGFTDEEAVADLKINFEKAKQNWKSSRFSSSIIYDAERNIYPGYTSLSRPLMPNASDNVVAFEFVA